MHSIELDDSVMDADKIVWLKMCRVQLSEADRMTAYIWLSVKRQTR